MNVYRITYRIDESFGSWLIPDRYMSTAIATALLILPTAAVIVGCELI
jgi:hypothetical protein